MQITTAIHLLDNLSSLTTLGDALSYIYQLEGDAQAMICYKELFPEEWARSEASHLTKDKVYTGLSERQVEFLKLIEKHYDLPVFDEVFSLDWETLDYLPVFPFQPHDWHNGDWEFEELELAYQLAIIAFDTDIAYWHEWEERYDFGKQLKPFYDGPVTFGSFQKTLAKEKSPLKHLILAMEMVDYSTGNSWIDYCGCDGNPYIAWTAKNVKTLSASYQEAVGMMQKIYELSEWLEEDKKHIAQSLIKINRMALTEHGKQRKTDEGCTLVEILA